MTRDRADRDAAFPLQLGNGKEDAVLRLADAKLAGEAGAQLLELTRHGHQIAQQLPEDAVRTVDEKRRTRRRQRWRWTWRILRRALGLECDLADVLHCAAVAETACVGSP